MRYVRNSSMTVIRSLTAAAILLIATGSCPAQEEPVRRELWRIGVHGGGDLFEYDADMHGLPGVPSCCPEYTKGDGRGISVGVSAEAHIISNIAAGLRLGFSRYDGTLNAEEREVVTADQEPVIAVFGHSIQAIQPVLSAQAELSFETLPDFRLTAGARADLSLGGTYHQKEQILTPSTIRYENGLRQRLVFDGDIPQERKTNVALVAGLRYDLPLNHRRTLILSPEAEIWQGLGDLIEGERWRMRGIRLGLALYFIGRAGARLGSPLNPGER